MMAEKKQKPQIACCAKCGCTEIQITAWLVANTDELAGEGNEGPLDSCWCPMCQDSEARYEYRDAKKAEVEWMRKEKQIVALRALRAASPELYGALHVLAEQTTAARGTHFRALQRALAIVTEQDRIDNEKKET